jgi:hypothetical protein
LVQRRNGLQTDVVHAPEHRREDRKPHQDHHPLEVDGVADVRRALSSPAPACRKWSPPLHTAGNIFPACRLRKVRLNFFKQVL